RDRRWCLRRSGRRSATSSVRPSIPPGGDRRRSRGRSVLERDASGASSHRARRRRAAAARSVWSGPEALRERAWARETYFRSTSHSEYSASVKSLFITGGTGNLGSSVVQRLARDYRCVLLVHGEHKPTPNVEAVRAD